MVTPPGHRSSLAVGLFAILLLACNDLEERHAAGLPVEDRKTELVVFVFDRSSSITDHELEHAAALTQERLGRLGSGDRVVAIELLERDLAEAPRRWSQEVPEPQFAGQRVRRDSVTIARFIQDVRDYIDAFSSTSERDGIGGTDILSTLHLVAAELQAETDRSATLVLYSDMLQVSQVMNMEGLSRIPPADWIRTEASRGTLPKLNGLCVVVVGARTDTPASQVVKEFWDEYFAVTGARLEDYHYRPVHLPKRSCPEA